MKPKNMPQGNKQKKYLWNNNEFGEKQAIYPQKIWLLSYSH